MEIFFLLQMKDFLRQVLKPIFEITTKRGLKLKGTDNHLIKT